jgi:hypothetical protein
MEDSDTVRALYFFWGGFLNDIGEGTLEICNAILSTGLNDQPNGIGIFRKEFKNVDE